jgi:hypothetical protein
VVEKVVEAKEATETLHAEKAQATVTHVSVAKDMPTRVLVSVVIPSSPSKEPAASEEFTREVFEGALDKASRPVRGKYADVPTSSEEFARRKQEEIDSEERR